MPTLRVTACAVCRGALLPSKTGRPRVVCSERCRRLRERTRKLKTYREKRKAMLRARYAAAGLPFVDLPTFDPPELPTAAFPMFAIPEMPPMDWPAFALPPLASFDFRLPESLSVDLPASAGS